MTDIADLKIQVNTRQIEEANRQLSKFVGASKRAQDGLNGLSNASGKAGAGINRVSNSSQNGTKNLNTFSNKLQEMAKAASFIQGPLGGMAARLTLLSSVAEEFNMKQALLFVGTTALAGGVIIATKEMISMADSYKMLEAKTKVIIGANGDAVASFKQLLNVSRDTGASIETIADVNLRVAQGAQSLGKTNAQVLALTESVAKLGTVSGAAPQNLQAGLLQFGQMLSMGVAHAEEFNSILENIPALAKEIAKGLNTSVGGLRQMLLDGKLLSKDVFEALEKRSVEIARQFKEMPMTIGRAMNELKTTLFEISGDLDKELGVTKFIATFVHDIAGGLLTIKGHIGDIVNLLKSISVVALLSGIVVGIRAMGAAWVASDVAGWVATFTALSKEIGLLNTVIFAFGRALTAIGWGIAIAGAIALTKALFDFSDSVKRGQETTGKFNTRVAEMQSNLLTSNSTLLMHARVYDDLSKNVKKSVEDQKNMAFVLQEVKDKYDLTTDAIVEQVKKYGSLETVMLRLNAIEEIKIKKDQDAKRAQDLLAASTWELVLAYVALSKAFFGGDLGEFKKHAEASNRLSQQADQLKASSKKPISESDILNQVAKDKFLLNKAGVPDSITQKGKNGKGGAGRANFLEDLAAEEASVRKLLELRKQSENAYQKEKNYLEALSEIKQKNLKFSESEMEALAERVAGVKDVKKGIDIWGQFNTQIDLATSNNNRLSEAVNKGAFAFKETKDLVEAEAEAFRLVGTTEGPLYKLALDKILEVKKSANELSKREYLKNLEDELSLTEALTSAYYKGTQALLDQVRANKIAELTKKNEQFMPTDEAAQKAREQVGVEYQNKMAQFNYSLKENVDLLQKYAQATQTGLKWDQLRQAFIYPELEKEKKLREATLEVMQETGTLDKGMIENVYQYKIAMEKWELQVKKNTQTMSGLEQISSQFGQSIEKAFGDALQTGEFNFKKFASAILRDLGMMIIKAEILNRIFGGYNLSQSTKFPGIFTSIAKMFLPSPSMPSLPVLGFPGGTSGSIGGFAKGGVFNSPTYGVFGERGPETILPLSKTRDGKLGITATGSSSGMMVVNNITVNGGGGSKEQNSDLAAMIGKEIDRKMREVVVDEGMKQRRSGGAFNRRSIV